MDTSMDTMDLNPAKSESPDTSKNQCEVKKTSVPAPKPSENKDIGPLGKKTLFLRLPRHEFGAYKPDQIRKEIEKALPSDLKLVDFEPAVKKGPQYRRNLLLQQRWDPCRVKRVARGGYSGYCFLEFVDNASALRAIQVMTKNGLLGKQIEPKFCTKKREDEREQEKQLLKQYEDWELLYKKALADRIQERFQRNRDVEDERDWDRATLPFASPLTDKWGIPQRRRRNEWVPPDNWVPPPKSCYAARPLFRVKKREDNWPHLFPQRPWMSSRHLWEARPEFSPEPPFWLQDGGGRWAVPFETTHWKEGCKRMSRMNNGMDMPDKYRDRGAARISSRPRGRWVFHPDPEGPDEYPFPMKRSSYPPTWSMFS